MGAAGRDQLVQKLFSASEGGQRLPSSDHGSHLLRVLRRAISEGHL